MDGMIRFHLSGTENMLTYIQLHLRLRSKSQISYSKIYRTGQFYTKYCKNNSNDIKKKK